MTVVHEPPSACTAISQRRRQDKLIVQGMFVELHNPLLSVHRRAAIREQIVRRHLALARHQARQFNHRGEPLEDLVQVAMVGLLKAIAGFDPSRGADFSGYAIPTMAGELKRHFRDKGWSVKVPRRLKEMKVEVTAAYSTLAQRLGRMPTNADLAEYLGVTEEEIRECQTSSLAYSTLSLSAPTGEDEIESTLADAMGEVDPGMEWVEDRESLRPLLRELPLRERHILAMRFYGNMTQSQIAKDVGLSQMHVSRLLSQTLARLRKGLLPQAVYASRRH